MSLADNKRLYDVTTRKQLYIERIKVQFAQEFNYVLAQLSAEFVRLLSRIQYKTLDSFTKAELNAFIVTLRGSQYRIYSVYADRLLRQLEAFMKSDLIVSRRILATIFQAQLDGQPEENLSDRDAKTFIEERNKEIIERPNYNIAAILGVTGTLWASIKAAPIPANGLYTLPFIKNFTTSASNSVENLVRKAYANGSTKEELMLEVVGSNNKQGYTGQFQRIRNQGAAVTATVIQHVTGIVSSAVASTMVNSYVWLSVMDNRTSEICQERNDRVYVYGQGPLPPAHIRCRSHTAPVTSDEIYSVPSFGDWVNRQPAKFTDDFFDGEHKDKNNSELLNAVNGEPLSLEEYENKVSQILS